MTKNQQKKEIERRVNRAASRATTGNPVPIMELSNISKAARAAFDAGADDDGMYEAALAYAKTVAVKI